MTEYFKFYEHYQSVVATWDLCEGYIALELDFVEK